MMLLHAYKYFIKSTQVYVKLAECIMRFLQAVMLCCPAIRGMSLCHSPELDLAGRKEYLSPSCTD